MKTFLHSKMFCPSINHGFAKPFTWWPPSAGEWGRWPEGWWPRGSPSTGSASRSLSGWHSPVEERRITILSFFFISHLFVGGGEWQIVAWWRVQHLSSTKNAILLPFIKPRFLIKRVFRSCTAGAASKTGRWGSNNPQLCSSWRNKIIFKLAATCLMRNWTGPRSPVRIICHLYLLCSYPLMESMALRTVRGWVHYSPLSDAPPHLLLGSAVCSQSLLKSYICTLLVQAETFLMCIALICGAAAHSWSCLCSCLYSEPDPAILAKPPPLSSVPSLNIQSAQDHR